MKFILVKIRYWFAWIFSENVLKAINDGLTYEEVDAIARREANRRP